MPRSIDDLIAASTASPGRPSTLIEELSAEAVRGNGRDRIYTAILAARSQRQALRLDELCAQRSDPTSYPPLFGVPIAVKANLDLCGAPTSCGSRALARPAPARDAAIVRRCEQLGAVVLGKTNLDEAALGASGRNEHFGRCINPRGGDALSGGSSSGSAAAVARGQALLAIGTDTLGSVRIPAALCGVVGFKPSHGAIPMEGVAPLYSAFDTVGLITASLCDMQRACSALGIGAGFPGPAPETSRIRLLGDSALAGVDANVAADYRRCCDALRRSAGVRSSGFEVCANRFMALDFTAVSRAALWEVSSDFAARIGFQDPKFAARRGTLGQELRRLLERAAALPAAKLEAGRALLRDARRSLSTCFTEADALLTPTCPTDAVGAAAELPRGLSAFVVPANLAGLPAVSWPQAVAPGKTTSLQLIGRANGDRALIALAVRLQTLLGR